jgi:hypothetical protein
MRCAGAEALMPNRMVREGLMESEAVLSVPVEARWLFVIIVLSADDIGTFEATEFKLARRADVRREHAPKLMQLLADADLVRLYEAGGKRFGFIPKFGQRVQIRYAKHPMPPAALYHDDPDAAAKIKQLASKTSVAQRLSTVGQPSEAKAKEENISSSPTEKTRRRRVAVDLPTCPFQTIVDRYHERLPTLPRVRLLSQGRKAKLRSTWRWVLTSKTSTGNRRATTVEEAIGWFDEYFRRASTNDFLTGRTSRSDQHAGWQCDLDFLLTDRGMKQVIEKTQALAA